MYSMHVGVKWFPAAAALAVSMQRCSLRVANSHRRARTRTRTRTRTYMEADGAVADEDSRHLSRSLSVWFV